LRGGKTTSLKRGKGRKKYQGGQDKKGAAPKENAAGGKDNDRAKKI